MGAGADFTQEHAEHAAANPRDGAQVHAEQAVGFGIDGQAEGHVLLHAALGGRCGGQRCVGDAGQCGGAGGQFLVAVEQGGAELLPALLALAQDEYRYTINGATGSISSTPRSPLR